MYHGRNATDIAVSFVNMPTISERCGIQIGILVQHLHPQSLIAPILNPADSTKQATMHTKFSLKVLTPTQGSHQNRDKNFSANLKYVVLLTKLVGKVPRGPSTCYYDRGRYPEIIEEETAIAPVQRAVGGFRSGTERVSKHVQNSYPKL